MGAEVPDRIFHNPPEGDRRDVVPSVGNLRFGGLCPDQVAFWRFRYLRWYRAIVSLVRTKYWFISFRDRGGFVIPYRWLTLGVGFGRSAWRWLRLILTVVRLRYWFRTSS